MEFNKMDLDDTTSRGVASNSRLMKKISALKSINAIFKKYKHNFMFIFFNFNICMNSSISKHFNI